MLAQEVACCRTGAIIRVNREWSHGTNRSGTSLATPLAIHTENLMAFDGRSTVLKIIIIEVTTETEEWQLCNGPEFHPRVDLFEQAATWVSYRA